MAHFDFGMKIYNNDWFLKYGLSYQEAAACLREWGVNYVLARSKYLAIPDSAVDSESPPHLPERVEAFNDRRFRDALAAEGIKYWATDCTFFSPSAIEAAPSLRPIGSDGQPMEKIDWYIGIPPSHETYVNQKAAAIQRAVRELEPDGVFLSFTRWPGFWELWMPDHTRQDFPEFSYDEHSLKRFTREADVNLPTLEPAKAAKWIEEHAREAWTQWKCQVVVDVIQQIKTMACQEKPETQIMLNTLPFGLRYFDNAQEKVFGQQLEILSEVVDVFEVMTYHQILNRSTGWIAEIGNEVKHRTGRRTVCTLQAKPHYLEACYNIESHRSPTIDRQEFTAAVNAVEAANLDGVVVFVWADLLEMVMTHHDTSRIDAISTAAKRRMMHR